MRTLDELEKKLRDKFGAKYDGYSYPPLELTFTQPLTELETQQAIDLLKTCGLSAVIIIHTREMNNQ